MREAQGLKTEDLEGRQAKWLCIKYKTIYSWIKKNVNLKLEAEHINSCGYEQKKHEEGLTSFGIRVI